MIARHHLRQLAKLTNAKPRHYPSFQKFVEPIVDTIDFLEQVTFSSQDWRWQAILKTCILELLQILQLKLQITITIVMNIRRDVSKNILSRPGSNDVVMIHLTPPRQSTIQYPSNV